MGFTGRKIEILIGVFMIALIAGVVHIFKGMPSKVSQARDMDIVYEMPRPKSFQGSDFDLSGRQVDRKYVNPYEKQKKEKVQLKQAGKPAQIGGKKDAKTAQKNAKDSKQAADAKKKKQVTARVIGKDEKPGFAAEGDSAKGNSAPGTNYSHAPAYNTQAQNNTGTGTNSNNNEEEEEELLSPDQWRALLLAQPTNANLRKMMQAYSSGKLDSQTYYTILSDLLKTNNPENQTLALSGAQAFPSAQSFVFVVQQESAFASSQLQESAQKFLLSYAQSSRVGMLMSVLQMQDAAVVAKATEVVLTGYQNVKNGIPSSGSGNGDVSSAALANFQKFIPLFEKLAQSNDSAIASLANSALAQFQMA